MSQGITRPNAAVLVGNGMSIAFNPRLNLASITREMITRMTDETDNGDQVVHAMKEIARRALGHGEVTDGDFEKLVGAFDSQALTLDELSNLAGLVAAGDTALSAAIREVTSFSERVRDKGVSHVLEVIMEQSVGDWTEHEEMHRLVRAIVEHFTGDVYFGNLNYDTLLLSSLMAIDAPLTDLGHGYQEIPLRIIDHDDPADPGTTYNAPALRRTANFPIGDRYRVKLLHLHGSLTYWHSTTADVHVKVKVDVLRRHNMWSGLREADPKWRPTVVLANQRDKAHHVGKYPFNLAYDTFHAGLQVSDKWLVVGYSFRDSCVNEILRQEFLKRSPKPRVLVSTFGDTPSREEVELVVCLSFV